LSAERRNDEFLPRVEFPALLTATSDLEAALATAN
jgi:glycerol-3-phosphate dehydrogenase